MNNDGWGFLGAGASDMRQVGEDLQHNRQTRTDDENPAGMNRTVRQTSGLGGPMKEAIDKEMARHKEARVMRLKHLEDHYKR